MRDMYAICTALLHDGSNCAYCKLADQERLMYIIHGVVFLKEPQRVRCEELLYTCSLKKYDTHL